MSTRPPEFDKALLKHTGLIRWYSYRYARSGEDKTELAQEVFLKALEKWENLREDGSLSQWLRYLTWQIVSAKRERKHVQTVSGHDGAWDLVAQPANQETVVDALAAIRAASQSDILMEMAMGATSSEIAKQRGVHRNAVRQMAERHRAKYLQHEMAVAA